MGTRSAVFYKTKEGDFKGSYIHWDGYIEGVGIMLQTYYRDKKVIKKLVDTSSFYRSLLKTVKDTVRDTLEGTVGIEKDHYRAGTLEDILAYGEESDLEYIYVFIDDGFLVSYGNYADYEKSFKEFCLLEDLIADSRPKE
jgi:hypothetical protein